MERYHLKIFLHTGKLCFGYRSVVDVLCLLFPQLKIENCIIFSDTTCSTTILLVRGRTKVVNVQRSSRSKVKLGLLKHDTVKCFQPMPFLTVCDIFLDIKLHFLALFCFLPHSNTTFLSKVTIINVERDRFEKKKKTLELYDLYTFICNVFLLCSIVCQTAIFNKNQLWNTFVQI